MSGFGFGCLYLTVDLSAVHHRSLSPEFSMISSSMDGTLKLWRPDTLVCERLLAGDDGTPVQAGFTVSLSDCLHDELLPLGIVQSSDSF